MSYTKGHYPPLGAPMPYPLKGLGAPMPYPLRGLGQVTVPVDERQRYGRTWEFLCFPAAELRQLVRDMKAWNPAVPSLGESDQSNDFKEEMNPVYGFKMLWIRMGKRDHWWPGAKSEHFNFGPTTYVDGCVGTRSYVGSKPANAIRVDQEFWGWLRNRRSAAMREMTASTPYPASLWQVHSDSYVRLHENDPLLEVILANLKSTRASQGSPYLAPHDVVSVKDDSPFVRALKTYFLECARAEYERQLPPGSCGRWPGGFNFGPNTSGNEIRIDPTLLFRVLNFGDPRAIAARERASGVLRAMRIKPPLLGGLPPVRPGGNSLVAPSTAAPIRMTPTSSTLARNIGISVALRGWTRR